MAGERDTTTQPSCMVTIEMITYEERESWNEWLKVCPCCLRKRDVEEVVTVQKMVQHTDEQEVGVEGKSQPNLLRGNGWCKISTWTVRNRIIDVT